jgi:hypothetical protein
MKRIIVLVVGLLMLQATPASAAPDVVRQRTCSDGARSRLELTDIGDRIRVRFEVYRSPVGHSWRIVLRHGRFRLPDPFDQGSGQVKFVGTRVASENGDFAVQRLVRDQEDGFEGRDGFAAKARDRQTGQFCGVTSIF